MKKQLWAVLVAFVSLSFTPCLAHHMAVVVSEQNNVTNLTSSQLGKLVRAETHKWADGTDVVLVLHNSSPGESITLQHLNRMSAPQLQNWMKEHHGSVKFVDSDSEVLGVVESTPGAVGLVDVRAVNNRVKVLHVDGKLPMEAGYLPH